LARSPSAGSRRSSGVPPLVVHRLTGAEEPQAVTGSSGNEYFTTVFATAGWDLSVSSGGEVPLPGSLVGVQNPNTCWSSQNSHTLMQTVPGYNPGDLDTVWRAHLLVVPAALGCSRGRMFDNGPSELNNIKREGAVTHSHDGYPPADSANFGAAENGLQKDFPRAFLRSASHEVGHTFNQIHQELEGGEDNSIMTTHPAWLMCSRPQGKRFRTTSTSASTPGSAGISSIYLIPPCAPDTHAHLFDPEVGCAVACGAVEPGSRAAVPGVETPGLGEISSARSIDTPLHHCESLIRRCE
jgi:hypothetical protein